MLSRTTDTVKYEKLKHSFVNKEQTRQALQSSLRQKNIQEEDPYFACTKALVLLPQTLQMPVSMAQHLHPYKLALHHLFKEKKQCNSEPTKHLAWQIGCKDSKQVKYLAWSKQSMIVLWNHNLLFQSAVFSIRMILKRSLTSAVRVMPPGTEKFPNKNYLSFHRPLLMPPGPPVDRSTDTYRHAPTAQLSSGTSTLQPLRRQGSTTDLFYQLGCSRIHCAQRIITHKLRRSQSWKGARWSPASYYLRHHLKSWSVFLFLLKYCFRTAFFPFFFFLFVFFTPLLSVQSFFSCAKSVLFKSCLSGVTWHIFK